MVNSNESVNSNRDSGKKKHPLSAISALLCSGIAALIMVFLIPFGILEHCSIGNITIFLALFGISVALVLSGIIIGSTVFRKTKNRLAFLSLLISILYIALLLFLVQLM